MLYFTEKLIVWSAVIPACGIAEVQTHIAIYMPIGYDICMKRTALFLKEDQLKKLLILSERTGAPVAELIRRAIDGYLQERAKELK